MNTDTDIVVPAPEGVDDTFHVRDEESASWVVRKIVEERAHRQRVAEWFEAETRRSERREAFLLHRFGAELAEWARQQLAKQYGKQRSINLPAGRIGFRVEPTRIIVADEPKLIAWCRQHLPGAVKVVQSILKTELKQHIRNTGECPDGADTRRRRREVLRQVGVHHAEDERCDGHRS